MAHGDLDAVRLLATAVVLLVVFLAATLGAAATLMQAQYETRLAFFDLRAWYRGIQERRVVEELTVERLRREYARSSPASSLPPPPLDETWPGARQSSARLSSRVNEVTPAPMSVRPPPLPDPVEEAPPSGLDWRDSRPPTLQMMGPLVPMVPGLPENDIHSKKTLLAIPNPLASQPPSRRGRGAS